MSEEWSERDDEGPEGRRRPLVRGRAELPDVTPEAVLRRLRGLVRGFWERDGRWVAWGGRAAGIRLPGAAAEDPFRVVQRRAAAIRDRLASPGADDPAPSRDLRFYGGFSFRAGDSSPRADGSSGHWAGFPLARFDVPAVEVRGGGGEAPVLVVTLALPPTAAGREAVDAALDRLRRRLTGSWDGAGPEDVAGEVADPRLLRWRDRPGRREWRAAVEAALDAVADGGLRKVVLARAVDLEMAGRPDPVVLLSRLRVRDPGAFPFLLEPVPGRAFVGASPEIVAARRGGRFHATAVAGTVPSGDDPVEGRRQARRLMASRKDRAEHEIGVRDMREALLRLAEIPEVDEEPHVLHLSGMQHLRTNFSARVAKDRHVLELLRAMHPTAAVNGYPREPATAFLRRWEPFDRGWYAGPVGWFDASGDGEFAPGLRSAVVRDRRVRLFAGAGLVEGSDPDREWEETGLKLEPVLDALAVRPPAREDGRPGRAARPPAVEREGAGVGGAAR